MKSGREVGKRMEGASCSTIVSSSYLPVEDRDFAWTSMDASPSLIIWLSRPAKNLHVSMNPIQ